MDSKHSDVEPLARAIESLNRAWEVLTAAGLEGVEAVLSSAATKAGCTEYCGSYDGCTGYCKPMGAAMPTDKGRPPERAIEATRLPFAGEGARGAS